MAISSSSISTGLKRATSERFFTTWRLALIGIFAFAVAFYYQALAGSPISDDYQHLSGSSIGGGTLIGALTKPFLHEYYRPVTSLSYFLDFKLWGPNPAMWHLTSIVIHGLVATAVTALGWIAIKCKHVAIFAGLFFAVQPAQVGAAAWIGGRTDELSALFATIYLLGLVTYFNNGKKWQLVAAAFAFFIACATKEQNLGFLVAAPILERVIGQPSKQRMIASTVAVVIAAASFAALWLVFYPQPHATTGPGLDQVAHRVMLAYLHYVGLIVVPNPLAVTALSLSSYGWMWLIPAAGLLIATPWIVKSAYRFDHRAGAFLLTFLIVYLPISNIITIPSTQVAPYRIANGSILIALVFGFLLGDFMDKKKWVPVALLTANLILSAGVSFWTIGKWSNEADWWNTSLQYDPHDRLIVRSATSAFMNMPGGPAKAISTVESYLNWLYDGDSWRLAVDRGGQPAITPALVTKFDISSGGRIDPHVVVAQLLNLRGASLVSAGQPQEALKSYIAGFKLSPSNGYPSGIGDLLIKTDRKTALDYYKLAVASAPSYQNLFTYGRELHRDGNDGPAEESLVRAVQTLPNAGDGWVQLGLVEHALGKAQRAQACLKAASSLRVMDKDSFDQLAQTVH